VFDALWHSTLNQGRVSEPGNAPKPRTCRNTLNTGASCFLNTYSSARTGAEQPAPSALWSLVTEVNITPAPGSASSPHIVCGHTRLYPPTTDPSAGSSPGNTRASGPKPLSTSRAVYSPVTPTLQLPQHSTLLFSCTTGGGRGVLSRGAQGKHPCRSTASRAWPSRSCRGRFQHKEWHRCCDHSPQKLSIFVQLKGK